MAHRGGEFSFFLGIHVRIDISISIKLMITKFGKQKHLQDLIQMRSNLAGAGDAITSGSRDKLKTLYLQYQLAYGHQTWQDDDLP